MDILEKAVGKEKLPCVQRTFNIYGASVDKPDDIGRLVQQPMVCGIPLFELIELIKEASIEAIPTPKTLELEQFLIDAGLNESQVNAIVESGITYQQLPETNLTQIQGIGKATAEKIIDALSSGGI